jgi:hypothetical protein
VHTHATHAWYIDACDRLCVREQRIDVCSATAIERLYITEVDPLRLADLIP